MKMLRNSGLMFLAVLLLACNNESEPTKVQHVELNFVEFEKEVEPYPTRVVVTPEFMRFDDGAGSQDFIIFDRNKDIIYSVNSEEQTVMSVAYKASDVKPPFDLKLEEKHIANIADAPKIEGMQPLHYQFSVKGQTCYDVVAVKGLMTDVVQAMQAFSRVLESDSKLTFHTLPQEMQDPCDMAMTTFAAGQHLKFGFPIQEWSARGAGRSLVDYNQNYTADPQLFVLPATYKHYSLQDFREGKVSFGE